MIIQTIKQTNANPKTSDAPFKFAILKYGCRITPKSVIKIAKVKIKLIDLYRKFLIFISSSFQKNYCIF